MSIVEISESKISLPVIDSNVVLSSDFLNLISEKNMESVIEAIRYLTLSKEKNLNPVKFNPYFVGFEVDHIETEAYIYPQDIKLKIYMSSGFLFYKGIFFIPEITIPVTLKFRIENPNEEDRVTIPYVYISDEEINLYFSINKLLDSYKEPREIFDGKNFIQKLVSSCITYEVKVYDSPNTLKSTDTDKEFIGGVQFGKVTRKNIINVSSDFHSYNRKVISTDKVRKDDIDLEKFIKSETSKTKLDYYKKFQVGEVYKLNHLKKETETPEFPFITGDTPLSLVDKEKTPDFYDYLYNYKLPFSLEIDGFIRNEFPRNTSGKCVLTLFFNLKKIDSVMLKNMEGIEFLQGNIIPYLISMLPMHPVRTVELHNYKIKTFNDHHFGTNNESIVRLNNTASITTKGKTGITSAIDGNFHSDSMPEKSKGIVAIPKKQKSESLTGNAITIVNGNVIKRGTAMNSSIFDITGNADSGVDFNRDYFVTAFNGSSKAIKLYRDESIEPDTTKATHLGITIDDFCYMSKNAQSVSFLHTVTPNQLNWILEFYPYRIPQTPSFEFIPANLPWGKGLTKPVNSITASSKNTTSDGGWCDLSKYSLTTEQDSGTLNSNVWYCDGYKNALNLLSQINNFALKYMSPQTPANESQEILTETSNNKKIIYTGHSGIDGNNKPSIMIPDSNGALTETRIENMILDMKLRHSKKSTGVWNFVYPRLILPLYHRQKNSDGSDYTQYELYAQDGNNTHPSQREDAWTLFSYLRPVTFIWLNNSMDFNSRFIDIVDGIISTSQMKMNAIRNVAGGRYIWVVTGASRTVPPTYYYGWRYFINWSTEQNQYTLPSYLHRFFAYQTALSYNYIWISLRAYGFGIFNGMYDTQVFRAPQQYFQLPSVNRYEGDTDVVNMNLYSMGNAINGNYYRGSTVQMPYAWLEEYKRGNSDMNVYLTGLFFDRSIIKKSYASSLSKGLFPLIESVLDLNVNSIDTTNSFNIYTPFSYDDSTDFSVSRPLYPFYVFGGSMDKNAGSVMYTVSLATDTMPSSNTNEYTFLFPLEKSEVTDKVSGRYPIPTNFDGQTQYLIDEWKPETLKEKSKSITASYREDHLRNFQYFLNNNTYPIYETVGFRWTFANGDTQEYFRYYSLMVIEEFKKKNDLGSMYFIGVDLDNINKPGNRYAVWYPNRNSLGAKDIDDYIVDVIKRIAIQDKNAYSPLNISSLKFKVPSNKETTSPLEIFTTDASKSNNPLVNGYDGRDSKEDNINSLISSGGIATNDKGELSTSFLQALNIWGIDTSLVIYDPSNFFIKKYGGNDWILSSTNEIQLYNSPGTSVSGNTISEKYSGKQKENAVRKDINTIRFSISPYGKKDGFSYLYIGKVL